MFLQILEAFAANDSVFVQNCGRLMALSSNMKTMSHYEFRNICDTKLESIGQRISCYQEVPSPCRVSPWGYFSCKCPNPTQLSLNKWDNLLVYNTEKSRGELQARLYPGTQTDITLL